MKRSLNLGSIARRAGVLVVVLIALDLAATAVTIAAGAKWLHR